MKRKKKDKSKGIPAIKFYLLFFTASIFIEFRVETRSDAHLASAAFSHYSL